MSKTDNTTTVLRALTSSIALRTALLVLLISGLAGYGLLTVLSGYIEPKVQESINRRLVELVKTVEDTTSIACFTSDNQLAKEVAKGLLMNRDVERVIIATESETLTDLNRQQTDPHAAPPPPSTADKALPTAGLTIRTLASPFDAKAIVGKITVVHNQESIRQQVTEAMGFIRLMLMLQTAAIIIVIALIAIGYIAQPIHRISRRLNELSEHAELSASNGERIQPPPGHQQSEIGHMVQDINALIDRLAEGLLTERDLRLQREIESKRFQAIFENAETGLFVIDGEGRLLSFNPAFRNLLSLEIDLSEATSQPLLSTLVGEQAEKIDTLIANCLAEGRSCFDEIVLTLKDSEQRWLNVILNPVEDNQIQGVINDVTEARLREAQANKLALTDALTGLGNRLGFERKIEQLVNEWQNNPDRHFTLMLIDLDHFKEINDTHGHDAGDIILVHVSRQIEHSIRRSDYVARLGGDEFIILLPFVADRFVVDRLAKTLIGNITKPIQTSSGHTIGVGASIGVSLANRPDMKKEQIIKQADLALYAVKQAGRNGYRIFDEEFLPSGTA